MEIEHKVRRWREGGEVRRRAEVRGTRGGEAKPQRSLLQIFKASDCLRLSAASWGEQVDQTGQLINTHAHVRVRVFHCIKGVKKV